LVLEITDFGRVIGHRAGVWRFIVIITKKILIESCKRGPMKRKQETEVAQTNLARRLKAADSAKTAGMRPGAPGEKHLAQYYG
jgi:hypothetical protein